ncbi:MAG TPA: PorV/PorQ family protein [bacterium]|nr:PorV/PorQ family protein [bacterium]HPN31795.1 PorV/PorQ family protein [bacterium]
MLKKIVLSAVCICLIFVSAVFSGNGTHSVLFLRMPTSAAVAGLNGAYTSLADDVNSLSANPAGLSYVSNKQFLFMHNNYFEDLTHNYIGYCQPVNFLKGTLGINCSLFDAGDIEKTRILTGVTYSNHGDFDAKDMAIGLSYGKKMNENINAGISLKYINSKIESEKANAFAMDLGAILKTDIAEQPVKFGAVIKNLGTKLKYDKDKESLPSEYKLGASSLFPVNDVFSITPSIDLIYVENEDFNFNIGSECCLLNSLFIRMGYDSSIDAGNGLSYGLGFKINRITIDYAFASYDDIGDAHRISLTIK